METLNLSLYPTLEINPKIISVQKQIPETVESNNLPTNPLSSLENALSTILPKEIEETNIIRARRILGETANEMSDEQIECLVTEFQFLINSWLDEFEKEVFSGKTLKEILNEK